MTDLAAQGKPGNSKNPTGGGLPKSLPTEKSKTPSRIVQNVQRPTESPMIALAGGGNNRPQPAANRS
jgi:hypothetical protein